MRGSPSNPRPQNARSPRSSQNPRSIRRRGIPRLRRLRVRLVLETPDITPPLEGWLAPELTRIGQLLGIDGGSLTVAVVSDERMSQLHEAHAGVAGTTDVLTFDLRDRPDAPVEGDLAVCLDEARRQAARRGHDVRLEVLLYAVHGLLHLIGYDDHAPRDAAAMHRVEDDVLTQAGYGPVFRSGRGGSRRRGSAPAAQRRLRHKRL